MSMHGRALKNSTFLMRAGQAAGLHFDEQKRVRLVRINLPLDFVIQLVLLPLRRT